MDFLQVILFVTVAIVGLVISWKLIRSLINGSLFLIGKASDAGFMGLILLLIASVVAFPFVVIAAIFLGWAYATPEKTPDFGATFGLNIPGIGKRVQLEAFKPYKMSCGAIFRVPKSQEWSVLQQNKTFSAMLGHYKQDFYYIIDERQLLKGQFVFFQILRSERKTVEMTMDTMDAETRAYCLHVKKTDGITVEPDFGLCTWRNGLGSSPQGWFKYSNLDGPKKQDQIEEGFIIYSDQGLVYTVVLTYKSMLTVDEKAYQRRTAEEIVRSLTY